MSTSSCEADISRSLFGKQLVIHRLANLRIEHYSSLTMRFHQPCVELQPSPSDLYLCSAQRTTHPVRGSHSTPVDTWRHPHTLHPAVPTRPAVTSVAG
jgi:hypothetical protein